MRGEDGVEFFVESFPGREPVGFGGGFEERAEFCGVSLDAGGESARGIEKVGIGADVDVGAILADPVERFFRGEPLAEVEDEIGFEGAASFEEPVVMADLFSSGGAARVREDVGQNGPLESTGECEDRVDVIRVRESSDEEDAAL